MTLSADLPESLRERKAKRTRSELVDAAVQLCLKVGYENVTVDTIAAAADVSPRTFSRYFASKDAVFLAVLDPVTDRLIDAIREQPDTLGPLEALRAAYVAVLTRIAAQPLGQPSADDIAVMLRVVNSSGAFNRKVMSHRNQRTRKILAARTGVPLNDGTIELATSLFDAILVDAFGKLVADTDNALLGPRLMVERLEEALAHLVEVVADRPGTPSTSS